MYFTVAWLFYLIYSVNACDSGNYSLLNKTVIVTGAARGIGYAIADNFLSEGVKTIVIVDENATNGRLAAKALNKKHGCGKVAFFHCHVFRDMYCWDQIRSIYKNIDILVNNAGKLNEYDTTEMILTNVAALVAWSFRFRDDCRIDRSGPGGTIINISSRNGYVVSPFMIGYSATKYAVSGFTQVLGHDYNCQRTGVRVLGICPHFTHTEMTRQQMVEDEQVKDFEKVKASSPWQTADDVGKAVTAVYKTARTGSLYTVAGGEWFESPIVEYVSTEEIRNL